MYFRSDVRGEKSKVVTKLAEVFPTSGSMYTFLNVVSLWPELFRLIRMVFQSAFHNGALRLLISELLDLFPVSSLHIKVLFLPHKKSSVVIKTDWWVHLVEIWLRNTTKRKPLFFKKVWYEEFRSHKHQHSCGYFSCCVIVYRLSASLTDSSEDMAVKPPNTHLPLLTTVC